MLERLPSGHAYLDSVLGGGLPANSITVITGLPGAGKTLLAQQYVFRSATPERPALYCSTASEPLDKIVRYGQTLSFFESSAVGRSVFYEDLGVSLAEKGLAGAMERLAELLDRRDHSLLVIDSFKALAAFADDARQFRGFVAELADRLASRQITTLWIGEYAVDELATSPEFAVADGIIALAVVPSGVRTHRSLRVLKLRGSGFLSGAHAYRLSEGGLAVFPRLADADGRDGDAPPSDARISTGIGALDEMLGGGLRVSGSTLLAGPSGAGKTTLGLQTLLAGADAGEPVLVATIQESRTQLERMLRHYGWAADGITINYSSPVDLYVDEWIYEILETADRLGARRVLIDSLSDLELATADPVRFLEYVYSLAQRITRTNRHLLMTLETPALPGQALAREPISHLSDNVIILQHVPGAQSMQRTLLIAKSRASWHDPRLRPFTIGPHGVEIGEPEPAS